MRFPQIRFFVDNENAEDIIPDMGMVRKPPGGVGDRDIEYPTHAPSTAKALKEYPQKEGDELKAPGGRIEPPHRAGIIGRKHKEPEPPHRAEIIGRKHKEEADGVRLRLRGDASTYNPFKPGWKSGGPSTASGERYDPNIPTAAIKTKYRHLFSGVRPGHTSYADVEYQGKHLRVRINDVGPLTPGRVIDLNEAAMRHFDPSMKQGVLHGVTVTPLGQDGLAPKPASSGSISALPHTGNVHTDVHPELATRLSRAYKAMPDDVRRSFSIISGFRTHEEQAGAYQRSHGGRLFPAAAPGHSRHEVGEAVDISHGPALEWLHKHGAEYGLHFPVRHDPVHAQMIPGWRE